MYTPTTMTLTSLHTEPPTYAEYYRLAHKIEDNRMLLACVRYAPSSEPSQAQLCQLATYKKGIRHNTERIMSVSKRYNSMYDSMLQVYNCMLHRMLHKYIRASE